MKYHLSFDDYSEHNFKITRLLMKYNLQATFFIELESKGDRRNPMTQIKAISEMGFDIGCHTLDHSILPDVNEYELEIQTYYAKDLLEQVTGKTCEWFCPPRGRYDGVVVNKILEAGFKYIRTTKIMDYNQIVAGLNDTTIHVYDHRKEVGMPFDVAFEQMMEIIPDDGCMKLWGHGWEIERDGMWDRFEKVLERISHEAVD